MTLCCVSMAILFARSYKYTTSDTVHFSGQYFLYVYVDWYFYKVWFFSRHREMGVPMEKQSSDSPVCPKCNSTNVAKYLWGLPMLSDQLLRDIEEGRVILGGCIICGEDPKFHCNDCKYDWR